MTPFYGSGSTVSMLQSHCEETIYFLPFSSQEFLVLNGSTVEGWKTELTFEPTSGFEPRSPRLGIQCLNTRLLIVIDWYRLPYMQTCQVQKNFLLGLKSLKGATMDALEGVNFPNLSSRVLRKWHLSQTHKIVPQDSVFDHVLAVNFIPRIFFNGDAWCKC